VTKPGALPLSISRSSEICVQRSDEIRIALALDDVPRPLLRGASRAESQRLARDLEDLRNSLAHAGHRHA